ncbi:MAG: hypothetical protein ACE14V_02265 [bacterium]
MDRSTIVWWRVGCITAILMVACCFSVAYAQNIEKPDKDKLVAEETTWSPAYKDESVEVVAAKFGKQFDKKVIVSSSIKGKKIRAAGGALSYYVEAIGGTPVPVPYSEVYMAMKLGTVDGFMQGIVDLEDQKLKEVTKS